LVQFLGTYEAERTVHETVVVVLPPGPVAVRVTWVGAFGAQTSNTKKLLAVAQNCGCAFTVTPCMGGAPS
jgi:hypothetical protein